MKPRPFLSLIAVVLLLASCGDRDQPGCTDPMALNHDPDATIDDGSCNYLSDLYAGNWIANDTTFWVDSQTGDTLTDVLSYGFSITAIGHDRVQVNGWLSADCPEIEAVVSQSLLVPQASLDCEFEGFVCTRTDGRLRYYTTYTGGNFRGTALKRP
jgi:hypothetical protein